MRNLLLSSCLLLLSIQANGQDNPTKKSTRYSIVGGIGLVHYFNSLKFGADAATENGLGYNFRVMWEPEHRLALGIESGYYPIYKVTRKSTADSPGGQATLAATTILLNIRMRVIKDFYISGGTGIAILNSKANVLGNVAENSQISLSNFQFSAMYLKPLDDHFSVGGELKFVTFGKTEDSVMAIYALVSYKF